MLPEMMLVMPRNALGSRRDGIDGIVNCNRSA
jgi:hypothetical protein